ncbi:hypothetical protein HYFRA_00011965 [Hymenoscyphus fraxineus]|uniref:Uncharacterized protein n=1 Tax=Hymenoscyphus fraxineus TaxID=746836 RepID=A0A9N9KZC9_9HELO|nr:hypothetical protein HYFRA_00011965 [Hymenoscyphus fraxineus]
MQPINFSTSLVLLASILSATALPMVPPGGLPTAATAYKVKVTPEYLYHYHGGPFERFEPQWARDAYKYIKVVKNKLTGTPEPPPFRVEIWKTPDQPHIGPA